MLCVFVCVCGGGGKGGVVFAKNLKKGGVGNIRGSS